MNDSKKITIGYLAKPDEKKVTKRERESERDRE